MLLRGEQISKKFSRSGREFQAVAQTDFYLEGGSLCVVQGRSGSGKTTLLNILSGILEPSSGKVLLDDTDLYAMGDKALSRFRGEHCGIIPQGQSAISTLTVLENVILPGTIYSKDPEIEKRAKDLLEKMQIKDLEAVLPKELSGGELRRMAIARALIQDPEVIFADEPTSDLDDANTRTVFEILKEIAQSGKAVFVISHEKCAPDYADVMYRMNDGHLESVSGSMN